MQGAFRLQGFPGCRGQGAGGLQGDCPFGSAVTVVMVQGGMRETQDKAAEPKAPQQRSVVALKGQLLHWRLLVANTGQHTCNMLG